MTVPGRQRVPEGPGRQGQGLGEVGTPSEAQVQAPQMWPPNLIQ